MKIYLINFGTVSIIVLYKPLATDVPDVDGAILATTGNASAIRMEPHRINSAVVIDESVDALSRGEVPQLHCVVIGAGCYQSLIWRKGTRTDPIIVRSNRE